MTVAMKMAGWLLFAAVMMIGLSAGSVLADGEIVVSLVSVDDSSFPEVSAVFTADEAGRPLTNVTAPEISLTEGGAPGQVVDLKVAADAAIPLALLVTFDTSGSMAGANLAQAKAAASALFKNLSPSDRGGLLTFADEVRTTVPLGGSPDELQAAVSSLTANGNTALYDAVAQSGRIAAASGVPRRAVILVSDGEDFGGRSGITRAQSLQAAAEGQALFYVIGIGQQVDDAYLQELARQSGGRYFQAAAASDVGGIYATIANFLRSQYVVRFISGASASGGQRTVGLRIVRGSSTGSAQLSYRSSRPDPTPVDAATAAPELDAAGAGGAVGPAAADSPSDGLPWPVIVFFIILGALAIGVATWWWRRGLGSASPSTNVNAGPLPSPAPLPRTVVYGTLTALRGEELIQSISVDGRPLTVGGSENCDFQLDDPALSDTAVRLWWRDGALMAHVLRAKTRAPLLNGVKFDWASMKEGDELGIGPFVVRFSTDVSGAHR